jgi:hypothetical protein
MRCPVPSSCHPRFVPDQSYQVTTQRPYGNSRSVAETDFHREMISLPHLLWKVEIRVYLSLWESFTRASHCRRLSRPLLAHLALWPSRWEQTAVGPSLTSSGIRIDSATELAPWPPRWLSRVKETTLPPVRTLGANANLGAAIRKAEALLGWSLLAGVALPGRGSCLQGDTGRCNVLQCRASGLLATTQRATTPWRCPVKQRSQQVELSRSPPPRPHLLPCVLTYSNQAPAL